MSGGALVEGMPLAKRAPLEFSKFDLHFGVWGGIIRISVGRLIGALIIRSESASCNHSPLL